MAPNNQQHSGRDAKDFETAPYLLWAKGSRGVPSFRREGRTRARAGSFCLARQAIPLILILQQSFIFETSELGRIRFYFIAVNEGNYSEKIPPTRPLQVAIDQAWQNDPPVLILFRVTRVIKAHALYQGEEK